MRLFPLVLVALHNDSVGSVPTCATPSEKNTFAEDTSDVLEWEGTALLQQRADMQSIAKVADMPEAEEGKESGKARLSESSIWLDEAPIPIGHAAKQTEFCKEHPSAAWDKERMSKSIELVRNFTHALRKAGIPPMIMEGTLLGLFRQGFLINGDHDLDFWIPRQFISTPNQDHSNQKYSG